MHITTSRGLEALTHGASCTKAAISTFEVPTNAGEADVHEVVCLIILRQRTNLCILECIRVFNSVDQEH